MSEEMKPRAELVTEFQKLFDESTDESAKKAMVIVLEVLLDIRDGIIKLNHAADKDS